MAAADADAPDSRELKPFLEHLDDLRTTLIRSAAALALGVAVALPLTPVILAVLKAPLEQVVEDPDRFLRSLQVAGAFSVALRTSFWSGLLLSIPFILFFVGQFVFPGLTEREKNVVLKSSGFSLGLFFLGVALGYLVTLPVALRIMLRLHEWLAIQAEWTINSYVAFCTQLLIGFGLAFQLPVVVVVLGKLGIINSNQLRAKRRHVFVGLLILAMLLTPPDMITQLIMATPLMLLYEVCIWIVWATERREKETGIRTGRG